MSAPLVWIDLEMTGLNPLRDRIIEMATIITDSDLNVVAEGPVLAISQPQALLDGMDEWNINQHTNSGLIESMKATQISVDEAESQTLDFLRKHTKKGKSPLCGNSISHDRRFLVRYMPELADFFHYRNIDVSSVKELVKRWKPELVEGIDKNGNHRALADVYESIKELKFYKENLFN